MVGVNKKTFIIETAARLFSLQEYDATTTLQIARETGINEPAVFYHFKNKNKLFAEIINAASTRCITRQIVEETNRIKGAGAIQIHEL